MRPSIALLLAVATPLAVGVTTQACYLVSNPEYVEVSEPVGANVLVQVRSTDGEPVSLALVTVNGVASLTDSAGFIRHDELPDGRFVARIDAKGYTSAVVTADVSGDTSVFEGPRLFALGAPMPFEAEQGASLDHEAVHLEIAPNTLVNAQGELVTGTVGATIVSLDPTADGGLDNLPCPLHAKYGNDANVLLRSIAMAEISVWQADEPLRLAPGARAHIELEIPPSAVDQVEVGQPISAWWLDLNAGTWRQDGVGTIELNEDNTLVWAVDVSHFTWWNCDLEIEWNNTQCVVLTVDIDDVASSQTQTLPDVGVTLTDDSLGAYKDKSTTLLTGDNRGGNCMVFETGMTPDLNIGTYTIALQDVPDYNSLGVGAGGCFANPEDDDYKPTSANANCPALNVHLPVESGFEKVCEPGTSQTCPGSYTGPRGTEGVGICRGDVQYCIEGGLKWSECAGQVTPQTETCTTVGIDDDCDGSTSDYTDGSLCDCPVPGGQTDCYTGALGTLDVGTCKAGTRTCELVQGALVYGQCSAQTTPTAEDCATTDSTPGHDENCDGVSACTGATRGTKSTNATIYDMAVGPNGEVYAIGHFHDVLWYDNKSFSAPVGDDSQNTLLLKFGSDDQLEWAKSYGGVGDDYGHSVAVAASGDLVITGSFANTVVLDSQLTNTSGVHSQIFVAQIDPSDGTPKWSARYGGQNATGDSIGYDVAINQSTGNIFVTGIVHGDDPFGDGKVGLGKSDAFILALDNNGLYRWSETYGGGNVERSSGIAVDANEALFITGYFYETVDFGNGTPTLVTQGAHDIFVAKLSGADGRAAWSRSFGSASSDIARGLALDSKGDVFVTGSFRDTITFGGTTWATQLEMGATPVDYAFVAALAHDTGDVMWSKGWVGNTAGNEQGAAIAVDNRDYVVFTGYFSDTANFGGPPSAQLVAMGTRGAMLVKLANNGDYVWSSHPANGTVRSIALTSAGHIHTGGDNILIKNDP